MDITTESLNAAGPCPVGRDEGLSKGFEELGKREDGSAEGELKADQVDGKEGRLFRCLHHRRDGQADRSDGSVDQDKEGDVAGKGATELPEEK